MCVHRCRLCYWPPWNRSVQLQGGVFKGFSGALLIRPMGGGTGGRAEYVFQLDVQLMYCGHSSWIGQVLHRCRLCCWSSGTTLWGISWLAL